MTTTEPAKPATRENKPDDMMWTLVQRLVMHRESGLVAALVVAVALFAVTAPNFLSTQNGFNILRQAAFVGIIALGMTLVIVAAEIDISVGALVALTSALIGVLHRDLNWPIALILISVLVVGAVSGTAVGLLRSYLAIPTIISTLALFLALRGAAEFMTDASPIPIDSAFLSDVLGGEIAGAPVPGVIFVLLCFAVWLTSTRTRLGREVYAVGGNAVAARTSGINVARVRVMVFAATGVLAALTGILLTARIGAASSSIGQGMEFEVIAAVIIGGTALSGGRGTVFGTVVGVLFVTVLGNALVLYGVNSFAQDIVRGAVVLLAVVLSSVQSRAYRIRD
ncbi:MAG: ABC transporter permease [Actinomycetia bacterium]|nr:ABC transporter permease [Actinomycetes bacterium]